MPFSLPVPADYQSSFEISPVELSSLHLHYEVEVSITEKESLPGNSTKPSKKDKKDKKEKKEKKDKKKDKKDKKASSKSDSAMSAMFGENVNKSKQTALDGSSVLVSKSVPIEIINL